MTEDSFSGGFQLPGTTGSEEYPTALAARIASRFHLPGPMEAYDFPEKGNINQQTFLIVAGSGEFLLQQINQEVFVRPQSVMKAMIACLRAQKENLPTENLDLSEWEPITLIPTRDGSPYLECCDRKGLSYWRLMKKISNCHTYKSLSEIAKRSEQLRIAEEAGRGLAIYSDLTAEMDVTGLENPLPGYRDTRIYFDELNSVLEGHRSLDEVQGILPSDPVLRKSTEMLFIVHVSPEEYERRMKAPEIEHFVELAKRNESFGKTLLRQMESGGIRTVAIHGDTKLDNFLFSLTTGRVRSLVDLDTIMPHTWLADWGDMVRSLANVAGEKERNTEKVKVDLEVFEAIAKGFLSTARRVTDSEVDLMIEGIQIIALELGIRFLTDYLRGDNYFKLAATDPPDLNKVRGMVQLRLFEQWMDIAQEAKECVKTLRAT